MKSRNFIHLHHRWDDISQQTEAGQYNLKRYESCLTKLCRATQDYNKKIHEILKEEDKHQAKTNKDGMKEFVNLMRSIQTDFRDHSSLLADFANKVSDQVTTKLKRVSEEQTVQLKKLQQNKKHREAERKRITTAVNKQKAEALRHWESLKNAHNDASSCEANLQSQDASVVHAKKLAKLQKLSVEKDKKERERRDRCKTLFILLEQAIKGANESLEEHHQFVLPALLERMEVLETSRVRYIAKLSSSYCQLRLDLAKAHSEKSQKMWDLSASSNQPKSARVCVRQWTDRLLSKFGPAPDPIFHASDLPCSLEAIKNGKWVGKGKELNLQNSGLDGDELKYVFSNRSGYLWYLADAHTWIKRFFVVTDTEFEMYREKKDYLNKKKRFGNLSLCGATIIRNAEEELLRSNSFTISPNSWESSTDMCNQSSKFTNVSLILSAEDQKVEEDWILLLETSIMNARLQYEKRKKSNDIENFTEVDDMILKFRTQAILGKDSSLEPLLAAFNDKSLHIPLKLCCSTSSLDYDTVGKALVDTSELISTGRSLALLHGATQIEVEQTASEDVLFRIDSICSKMLAYFARSTCSPYLHAMLFGCIVENVLKPSQDDISFEMNPNKLFADLAPHETKELSRWAMEVGGVVQHRETAEKKDDEELDEQRLTLVKRTMKNNQRHLETATRAVLQCIEQSLEYAPRRLRVVIHNVQEIVQHRWPDTKWSAVGAIFFLRFICPAISTGSMWRASGRKLSSTAQRNLLMVTKLLQLLANNATFGGRERFMCLLNPFLHDLSKDFSKFADDLANPERPDFWRDGVRDSPAACALRMQEQEADLSSLKELFSKCARGELSMAQSYRQLDLDCLEVSLSDRNRPFKPKYLGTPARTASSSNNNGGSGGSGGRGCSTRR